MVANTTGSDPETGRSLMLQTIQTPDEFPDEFTAPSRYFVAMLICDGTRLADKDVFALSRRLIDAGCAYLCCWGRDCERIHDLFDREWIDNGFDPESSDTIMTSWHTNDPLDDLIEHAIWFTEPTDKYQSQCRSVVALVIDDVESASRIKDVFNDPADFSYARELDA